SCTACAASGRTIVKSDWEYAAKTGIIPTVFQTLLSPTRSVSEGLATLRLPRYFAPIYSLFAAVKECPVDCREITPFSRSKIARLRPSPRLGSQRQGVGQRPRSARESEWQRRRRSSCRWRPRQPSPRHGRVNGRQAAGHLCQRVFREKPPP